jgi:uncharacterized protein YjbJ (UPF0337 family)
MDGSTTLSGLAPRACRGAGVRFFSSVLQGAIAVNQDQLKGKWMQVKGKAKEKWGKLTNDDLDVIDGQVDQLAGKLQERYGYERDRAKKEAEEFCSTCC